MSAYPDRVYFLARIWMGYTRQFNAAWLDDTPDGKIWDTALEMVNETIASDPELMQKTLPNEWKALAGALGWGVRDLSTDPAWLTFPNWQAVHMLDDGAITADLVEALITRAPNDHDFWSHSQIRIKVVAKKDLKRSEWANIERDIALLDGDWRPSVTTKFGTVYPLNYLRNEAIELSRLLRDAHSGASNAGPTAPTKNRNPKAPKRPEAVSAAFWAQLDPTKRSVLDALAKATAQGEGRTARQLVTDAGVADESTVNDAIKWLRDVGAEIPNPRNGSGYSLGSVPNLPQQPPATKRKGADRKRG